MNNFKENDGGRATSKRPKNKSDCVVRAVAIAFNRYYDEVYDEFVDGWNTSYFGELFEFFDGE